MSSVVEQLLKKSEGTISESVGASGIQELLARQTAVEQALPVEADQEGRRRNRNAGFLALDKIMPDPNQPRKHFGEQEIQELAKSLQRHGQLQSIRVRWSAEAGKYLIISGERRFKAAQIAGLQELAVEFVEKELTAAQVLEDQLMENAKRSDLSPIELGRAYEKLLGYNQWTQEQLAEALCVSATTVSQTLRLLGLSPELQGKIEQGSLPATVGYALTRAAEENRPALAAQYEAGELPGRDALRQAVRKQKKGGKSKMKATLKQIVYADSGVRLVIDSPKEADCSLDDLVRVLSEVLRRARAARQENLPWSEFAERLGQAHPGEPMGERVAEPDGMAVETGDTGEADRAAEESFDAEELVYISVGLSAVDWKF